MFLSFSPLKPCILIYFVLTKKKEKKKMIIFVNKLLLSDFTKIIYYFRIILHLYLLKRNSINLNKK